MRETTADRLAPGDARYCGRTLGFQTIQKVEVQGDHVLVTYTPGWGHRLPREHPVQVRA